MEISDTYLADEGILVTLSLGKILKYAGKSGLQLHRSWTLACDGGYLHPHTGEQVTDLTIGLFYGKNMRVPHYDRQAGEEVSYLMFPAGRTEAHALADSDFTRVDGVLVRGGEERSNAFFSWLLATFTHEEDYVIDVFSGCGGLEE